MMKIHLPNSAFLGNIDPVLRSFDPRDPHFLEITSNQKWISIHPVVLAMVAAIGLPLKPEQIHFERLEAKSKHYLERMGLFRLLGLKSGMSIAEHEPAGRFVPIVNITNAEALARAIADIVPLLHLTPHQAEPIRYVLSELIRNVLEHASAKNGALLCAQYYQKSNAVRVGIVDTGVGIQKTINASYPASSEMEAIRLALTPGVTGTTKRLGGTEYNAGAGLFFIKSIAKVSRDFFMIYSGKTMYKLLKTARNKKNVRLHGDPFEDRHAIGNAFPSWQGTAVGIDITLNPKREFSELLEEIRNTYAKTIREQKKARYKKARFL